MTRKKLKWLRFLRFSKNFSKSVWIFALRSFLFFSMVLILLAVTVWVIFLRAFNPQHISEVLTEELQKHLNRPVIISSLSLSFINTIKLEGFSVLDTQGEPGTTLLSADSVTLKFSLPALLDKQLLIEEVTLNSPRFNIVRREDNTYNIPPVKTSQKESVYTSGSGQQFPVHVNNWALLNGVISYKNLKSQTSHAIYGLNLHFERLRFDELSRFTLDMVARSEWEDKISEIEIDGAGHVNFANFDWEKFALHNFRLQAHLFKTPVELTLNMDNLRAPHFEVTAKVPAFSSKDLSLFHLEKNSFSLPELSLAAQADWKGEKQQIAVSQLTAEGADIKITGDGKLDFSQQQFTADGNFSTNEFSLDDKASYWPLLSKYKLKGKGTLSAQIAYRDGKFSVPVFGATVNNAQGEVYTFPLKKVTGEAQIKNNWTDWYVRTRTGQVVVNNSVFEQMNTSTTWRNGSLYANIASSTLNGTPFKMNADIPNFKSKNRKIRANLHWAHLDPMAFIDTIQDFVKVISPLVGAGPADPEVTGDLAWLRNFRDRLPNFMPNFAGSLSADEFSSKVLSGKDFDAEFNFTGLKAGAKELNGTLEARLKGGVIHQMEKLAEEQSALNVTFQPFIIMNRMEKAGSFKVGKVLKDVEFSEMAVSTAFENGKMDIRNAYTVGPTISANVSGWTDWVNETFDLTIWTMFHNTSRGSALAENLTDESGDPALAFRVSAAMNKPKLEMKSAKKTGKTIRSAQERGLTTDFHTADEFVKGDFHAKK